MKLINIIFFISAILASGEVIEYNWIVFTIYGVALVSGYLSIKYQNVK